MSNFFRLSPKSINQPGQSPGTIANQEDAVDTKMWVFIYSENFLEEKIVNDFEELKSTFENNTDKFIWIDLRGLKNTELLVQITKFFGIHILDLEDVLNLNQRPKVDEKENYLFSISRMFEYAKENKISNEQISIFTFQKFTISIQENLTDVLDPIRIRLRSGKGNMRKWGSAYLSYALTDIIIDNYFPILIDFENRLEFIDDMLLNKPNKKLLFEIKDIKRVLLVLRRAVQAEKEKMLFLLKSDFNDENTKVYLRDVQDHCIQALEWIDSYRELCQSSENLYLNLTGQKTNEVMKVLTVISAIFIPLTFIVGVYGMNFYTIDPITNRAIPGNMPELSMPYAYVICMGGMLLLALLQVVYFWRRGWLK